MNKLYKKIKNYDLWSHDIFIWTHGKNKNFVLNLSILCLHFWTIYIFHDKNWTTAGRYYRQVSFYTIYLIFKILHKYEKFHLKSQIRAVLGQLQNDLIFNILNIMLHTKTKTKCNPVSSNIENKMFKKFKF